LSVSVCEPVCAAPFAFMVTRTVTVARVVRLVAEREMAVGVAARLEGGDEQAVALGTLAAIHDRAVLEADHRGLGHRWHEQRRCRDERGDQ
jgi:hypothetical protein